LIKNVFSINGDVATLHITRRNGDKYNVLIDVEDLEVLNKVNYAVGLTWKKNIQDFYAQISIYGGFYENGKRKTICITLQRLLTNAKKNEVVDHKNHDTLDNRKINLRVTVNDKNTKNRSGKNANNKSGYRNVSLVDGKYIVQLQIEGKNTVLGSFDDVHEAGECAEKMRQKHYGEYAGKT
jgi:DUF971 family protein